MIRAGVVAALAAALAVTVAGCSIPAWVPLIGKDKPGARPVAKAPEPTAPSPATVLAANRERLPESDDVMDRVICVVNNDAITLYELEEAEATYLHENKETAPEGDARKALRQRLLAHLIESRVQLQQAEREKIVIEDSEVSDQVAEIMRKVSAKAQPEFEEVLKSQGLTLENVKKRIRDQLMVARLTRRKVALRVSVTEQEIDRYLAENRGKLETGLSFEAWHMLFLPELGGSDQGWEAARRKAENVYAFLLDGQPFAELARKYSEDGSAKDGGNLGPLKRGELAPEIETAILNLRPGEFSTPFRSTVGYHLFRLESKESLSGEALVQARSQIRDILYRQKYDSRLQEWLAEIKQRAIIDIRM
ncbi:MAG TPA: peptidylprolyl isomerase [Methylomirabilota bacterium]|jgi:peptidyl-prolyl cis-trans isomerase SurA|nr:peptidylprolyl isomerase [Methylomirabilota bacterium]